MRFTTRALLLSLVPALLVLLLSDSHSALRLYSLSNAVLILAIAVDYSISPRKSALIIHREIPLKFSLGTSTRVELAIENRSSRQLAVAIAESPPPSFDGEKFYWEKTIGAGETVTIPYYVVPLKRGPAEFGMVTVQARAPLGLITMEFSSCLNGNASVYPHIDGVGNGEMPACRGTLREMGTKQARIWGSGSEFESLRDYSRDDSYRLINWKATARRQRITVENFEVERTQNIIIAIDSGRLMLSEVESPPASLLAKIDCAINASLSLAALALKKDDRVGVIAFDSQIRGYIPPGKGRIHFKTILEMLKSMKGFMEETDFEPLLTLLESKNRKRSLLVIFTDFLDREISGENLKYITRLYPHHVALCVAIRDRTLQNEARRVPKTIEHFYTKTVAGELLWQREHALNVLGDSGGDGIEVLPEHLTFSLARKYMEYKIRGRI